MLCFKKNCGEVIQDVKSYRCHLKYVHNIKNIGNFVCTGENCSTSFTSFKHFSNHLINKHGLKNTLNNINSPISETASYANVSSTEPGFSLNL